MNTCKRCGETIPESRLRKQPPSRVQYCSVACQRAGHKEKYAEINGRLGISPGKVGAVSELVVCADLLRKGYEVFRSVSQDCSCDLVILKQGQFMRVEVRTGWRNLNGTIGYSQKPADVGRQDVIAIVLMAQEIIYRPEIA